MESPTNVPDQRGTGDSPPPDETTGGLISYLKDWFESAKMLVEANPTRGIFYCCAGLWFLFGVIITHPAQKLAHSASPTVSILSKVFLFPILLVHEMSAYCLLLLRLYFFLPFG